ncbi:MAG: synthase [Candidatus Methanomethylophilaceae archaeon]|nr:synthase [Candidatus Methanomethylophilaceae archaeon]
MKFIFVTGGVLSGLGKGITASSIGKLLKCRGLKVSSIKIDPYLNIDAGTMNPFEHGEVYVLDDGGEVDLDLGNYERFLDISLTSDHNITTGKVYQAVIEKERRGDYLGKTVQIIPHITNEIKDRITRVARESNADVTIVELGGTVGDIESMPFLEAARQLSVEIGREENCIFVHTTLVPILSSVGEQKTKPTQHSVKELMALGIKPDVIVGRSPTMLEDNIKSKISLFCDVPQEAVLSAPDARSIYEVPVILEKQKVSDFLVRKLKLKALAKEIDLSEWQVFLERVLDPHREVRISIVGKYTELADSYLSHLEALTHAGAQENCRVNIDFVNSDRLLCEDPAKIFSNVHGILVPGGFGVRGVEGKMIAAHFAREQGIPFMGICLGFQVATVEIARNVLGLDTANSTEFDPLTLYPVIDLMPEQRNLCSMGATMRLGAQKVIIKEGSLAYSLYKSKEIWERHRHRFEVNPEYVERFERAGWHFTGTSEDGERMEIGEFESHPYFLASQFHPEFKSRPGRPSPLHLGLVRAAIDLMESS